MPRTATFTPFPNQPNTSNRGTITINRGVATLPSQTGATQALAANPSPAPITSVSQFTPSSSFGGDIVRIEAGPGGEFGKGVYAVSRGAGDNAGVAINRPGVVYRVDPATGKASVFFDLNTVIPQLDPTQTSAANSLGSGTGLVNWYDITFDSEGIFDGRPSMFIASVDFNNTAKNAIYRVAPDGTFLGAYTVYSDRTLSETKLTFNPSAILVPPTEQQSFLRGLVAGTGSGAFSVANTTGQTFAALFFDANQFRPGTPTSLTNGQLPAGVKQTFLFDGPQTSLTAANSRYTSQVYATFADFGVPQFPADPNAPFPATPGDSGIEGIGGDLLINLGVNPNAANTTTPSTNIDLYPSISTNFRRFEDSAFDHYGYFSQGLPITDLSGVRGPTTGGTTYAGSMFVADLATGLSVLVPQPGVITGSPPPILIPVQGGGVGGLDTTTDANGNISVVTQPPAGNLGGRIIRIDEFGRVSNFAEGFNTSGAYDSTSFEGSSLSITFSADGTTLYAADDDGIWQFKTTASLAGSTSGSIVGLNDLRTLGVPYDGQNSAVDIVDTGVDARNTNFRGRVASGTSTTISNSFGNDDFATLAAPTTNTTNNNGLTVLGNVAGHGTPVAGVIAQFVPQATLNPVNVFVPFGPGGTVQSSTTGTGGTSSSRLATNQATSIDAVFSGLQYVSSNPYVKDPIRPLNNDRVIAANIGFGTLESFDSEGSAYKSYPQVVISFKNQLRKFLKLGIAPIAAAGQFGAPPGAGVVSNGTGNGGGNGNNNTFNTINRGATNNVEDSSVGDVNGMSLPAILNESISVTGTYPFLFSPSSSTPPTDPQNANSSVVARLPGPVLLFGNTFNTIGSNVTTPGTPSAVNGTSNLPSSLAVLTAAEGGGGTTTGGTTNTGVINTFSDRILGAANRNSTTDFAAPALDVPTFNVTSTAFGGQQNLFTQGGTSMSSAIVTGAYALVASALDYWTNLSMTGATTDAYLTQPVGARSLDFGHKSIANFRAYNNPDGINGILAYTAVPATDTNDDLTAAGPPLLLGSTLYRSYARVDVGNAIASIEGEVALNYLFKNGTFSVIDANHNNLITSQEIQNFVDNANAMGLPEAGAMARLLGGTARSAINNSATVSGEQPDQPDVLQRRFNYFDYASDGILNGAVSIKQLKMLQKNLLPTADQYSITDRQRASYNGFLIAPAAQRNFKNIQHISPKYQFVANSVIKKYKNVSPAQFGVNRGLKGFTQGPLFTLFDGPTKSNSGTGGSTTGTDTTGSASGTSLAGTDSGTDTPADTGTTASTSGTTPSGTTADDKKVADTTSSSSVKTADTPVVNQATDADKATEETQQALLDAMKKLAAGGSSAAGDATSSTSADKKA